MAVVEGMYLKVISEEQAVNSNPQVKWEARASLSNLGLHTALKLIKTLIVLHPQK